MNIRATLFILLQVINAWLNRRPRILTSALHPVCSNMLFYMKKRKNLHGKGRGTSITFSDQCEYSSISNRKLGKQYFNKG